MLDVLLLLLMAVLLGAVGIYLWRLRASLRGTVKPGEPRCQHCGYDLSQLELPRCPECGALRGFRVPLTKLGLTEGDVREKFARRRGTGRDDPESAGQAGDAAPD